MCFAISASARKGMRVVAPFMRVLRAESLGWRSKPLRSSVAPTQRSPSARMCRFGAGAAEVERWHWFVYAEGGVSRPCRVRRGCSTAEPFLGVVGAPWAGCYYYGVAGEFAVFEGYACYAVAFGLQSNCFALTNLRTVALCGAG